jgi:hypothetical protein
VTCGITEETDEPKELRDGLSLEDWNEENEEEA